MIQSIRLRAEIFKGAIVPDGDYRRELAASAETNRGLQQQIQDFMKEMGDLRNEFKTQNDKIQKQDDKIQKQDEKIQKQDEKSQKQDEKIQELTEEVKYFKNKFHLSSRRNFWQKYLQAVLRELGFKSEEIAQASTGDLYHMLDGTDYNNWRKKTEALELPTYAQLSVIVPQVIAEGNAAVHQSKMMKLFGELSLTGPNTVFYEKMWDFMAGKYEAWDKGSDLINRKQENN